MNTEDLKQLENDLWRSADTLRANSDLKSTEYSTPVLGLIFLKFADNKYRRNVGVVIEEDGKTEEEFVEELLTMNQELSSLNREARKLEKIIHHNVLKLTEEE